MKPMAHILTCFRELQELDRQIQSLQKKNDVAPDLEKRKGQIDRIKFQIQEKKQALDSLRLARNQTKGALDHCRDRIMKADTALKTSRNSLTIQTITESLAQLKTIEQGLELKDGAIETDTRKVQEQLLEIEAKFRLESETATQPRPVQTSDSEVRSKVRELETQKEGIASKLPASSYYSLYQRLIAQKSGVAIAPLRAGCCAGCFMALTAQFVNEARKAISIQHCPQCGRILDLEVSFGARETMVS